MYLGRIVEEAESRTLSAGPLHPYTQALFAAALPAYPDDGPASDGAVVVQGSVPSALKPPPGCHFHPRCPFAMPVCSQTAPVLEPLDGGRRVACHLHTAATPPRAELATPA
jgi:oligopeptide/dipeptide ABC transporter ATP-binding protein